MFALQAEAAARHAAMRANIKNPCPIRKQLYIVAVSFKFFGRTMLFLTPFLQNRQAH
jgi:hypothetical protein